MHWDEIHSDQKNASVEFVVLKICCGEAWNGSDFGVVLISSRLMSVSLQYISHYVFGAA